MKWKYKIYNYKSLGGEHETLVKNENDLAKSIRGNVVETKSLRIMDERIRTMIAGMYVWG